MSLPQTLAVLARMVKIEHSVFALPFAYAGMLLAARGWPGAGVFAWITVAMIAMRSFAMAVNRLTDLPFDARNPRTRNRPLVTGEITPRQTLLFVVVCGLIFVLAAAALNPTVLALSPLALLLGAGYSYAKRFTWLCHYWLGLVLGLSPVAGWLAVTGTFHPGPVLLGLGVSFWVAGFDILYALQDREFDRAEGLCSIPARFGVDTALAFSTFSHVNTVIFFLVGGWTAGAGWLYFLVMTAVGAVLLWEHRLVRPDDLSRVNMAFFTLNGVIAVCVLLGVLADVLLSG